MAETKNVYQRFIEVQKKVKSVIKAETVKMNANDRGYKAVSHDDVAALLHGPLADAGIVLLPTVKSYSTDSFEVEKAGNNGKYTQRWYRSDVEIVVKWINADKPDEFFESMGAAFALDTSDKSFAKAYSLALKIVLLKVHLLESRDGEEERVFEGEESRVVKKQQPQSVPVEGKEPVKKAPVPNNMAPATVSQIELINTLLDQRGIPSGDLDFLVLEGYGFRGSVPPQWIAKELILLLGDENTDQRTIVERTIAVKERRLAAQNKK
jgi:hypothetical protein